MTKLDELKHKATLLNDEIRKEEHKVKIKKGVLKVGEFCIVSGFNEGSDVLFYNACDTTVCMNAYFDAPSAYLSDILLDCEMNCWAEKPLKIKKITKQEAMKYL